MRTFIAIKIKPEKQLLTVYSALRKSLELEAVSWVNPENLHLTLRFLGETSVQQSEEIMHLLDEVALRFYPFQFNLKEAGFFKSKNQPRVLFFAVENGLMLSQLAAEIGERFVALGFNREERSYNPHLTIGRIKFIQNKMAFYGLISQYKEAEIQTVTVSEIVYYHSILTSVGAIYKPLKIFRLNYPE
jgi:RNA 2',3'-cyclic 3'-phosphodiesterase